MNLGHARLAQGQTTCQFYTQLTQAEEECLHSPVTVDISTHPSLLNNISDILMPSKSSISMDFSNTTFDSSTSDQNPTILSKIYPRKLKQKAEILIKDPEHQFSELTQEGKTT